MVPPLDPFLSCQSRAILPKTIQTWKTVCRHILIWFFSLWLLTSCNYTVTRHFLLLTSTFFFCRYTLSQTFYHVNATHSQSHVHILLRQWSPATSARPSLKASHHLVQPIYSVQNHKFQNPWKINAEPAPDPDLYQFMFFHHCLCQCYHL